MIGCDSYSPFTKVWLWQMSSVDRLWETQLLSENNLCLCSNFSLWTGMAISLWCPFSCHPLILLEWNYALWKLFAFCNQGMQLVMSDQVRTGTSGFGLNWMIQYFDGLGVTADTCFMLHYRYGIGYRLSKCPFSVKRICMTFVSSSDFLAPPIETSLLFWWQTV